MVISQHEQYLLLGFDASTRTQRVKISKSLSTFLQSWQYLHRVSPIFPVRFDADESFTEDPLFDRKSTLIFAGPINPIRLKIQQFENCNLWITFGLFNVIIYCQDAAKVNAIIQWLTDQDVRYERWNLKKNTITSVDWALPDFKKITWRKKNKILVLRNKHFAIEACGTEYASLLSSILSRT